MSIYIIRHKESDNCYIGSCEDMKNRRYGHTYNFTNENSGNYYNKLYCFMRENGGWDNFDMVEICKCDIDMLREMEQYHKDFIKPSLNTYNAYVSEEDKRINKSNNRRVYYKQNKERINKQNKEDYYNNREKRLEQKQEYNKQNKDKIKEWGSCVVQCECGKTYTKNNKARHFKTNYHLKHLPRH
jgi:hypothetical protein